MFYNQGHGLKVFEINLFDNTETDLAIQEKALCSETVSSFLDRPMFLNKDLLLNSHSILNLDNPGKASNKPVCISQLSLNMNRKMEAVYKLRLFSS